MGADDSVTSDDAGRAEGFVDDGTLVASEADLAGATSVPRPPERRSTGEDAPPAPAPRLEVARASDPVTWVRWSPDGARLASAGRDGTVRVWDPASGVAVATLEGHPDMVAWSPDGSRLASAVAGGGVRVWDRATGVVGPEQHPYWAVTSLAWSPDGSRLATGPDNDDGEVMVWDPVTGVVAAAIYGLYSGRNEPVDAVGWSPDGTRVAVAGGGVVRLWDPVSELVVITLRPGGGSVRWSPDGTRLAIAGYPVQVWDPVAGRVVAVLHGLTGPVVSVAWSPDGTRLAAAGLDGGVPVWDSVTGRVAAVLEGHTGTVRSVAWSPDGTRLAAAGADGTVAIWDPSSGVADAGSSPPPARRRRWWSRRPRPSPIPPARVTPTHRTVVRGALSLDWAGDHLAVATEHGEVRLLNPSDPAVDGLTMLQLPDGGWASVHRSGAYRVSGEPAGRFWWVVGDEHIDPGDADGTYGIHRVPIDAPWPSATPR